MHHDMRTRRESITAAAPHIRLVLAIMLTLALAGCATSRSYMHSEHHSITLEPSMIEAHGLSFITPATVTGKEQDAQTIALVFGRVARNEYADVPVVTLPETLSHVNRNELTDRYRAMLAYHADTGLLPRGFLQDLGDITGTRYIAQIKLAGFEQRATNRWSLLGIRILVTKEASLRVFMQVWDADTGEIAWEGTEEVDLARDTMRDVHITLQQAARTAAHRMFDSMILGIAPENDEPA